MQVFSGPDASPLDPFKIEISLTNKAGDPRGAVEFLDGEIIKGNQFMCC